MIITNQFAGNDNYTKLLIQSNNANGSTTFTDLSSAGNIITGYGGISHSTAQYKNGKSSIYFDGVNDYLSIPDSADWHFGSGNFTIDFWVRYAAVSFPYSLIGQWVGLPGGTQASWLLQQVNANLFNFYHSQNGNDFTNIFSTAFSFVVNTWYYLTVVRNGSSLKVFVNGELKGSHNIGAGVFFDSNLNLYIGTTNPLSQYLNGCIDQIRISKGISRYNSNFIPPNRMW